MVLTPHVVVPPTEYPVSLAEAKEQCGYAPEEDAPLLLPVYIAAATNDVEDELGVSLTKRTYAVTLDTFADAIELTRGPVTQIVSVQYADPDGLTQTLPAEYYTADLARRRPFVVRNSAFSWPAILSGINAVTVTYEAGFDQLPQEYWALKAAILLRVQMLDNRSADPRVVERLAKTSESLIDKHRPMFL